MDNDSRKKATISKSATTARTTRIQGKSQDMGAALRSIYDKAVGEPVPSDLMDLLGKLD